MAAPSREIFYRLSLIIIPSFLSAWSESKLLTFVSSDFVRLLLFNYYKYTIYICASTCTYINDKTDHDSYFAIELPQRLTAKSKIESLSRSASEFFAVMSSSAVLLCCMMYHLSLWGTARLTPFFAIYIDTLRKA